MNNRIIIAVDPGKNGGMAMFNGNTTSIVKMPETPKDLLDFFKRMQRLGNCVCIMEKVGGMPKMGGSPMFNFGKGYGHLEMALLALEIPTQLVTPQKWQKEFQLGTKSECATSAIWKNKLKALAQRLYPTLKISLWASDALLIGTWAKRQPNDFF